MSGSATTFAKLDAVLDGMSTPMWVFDIDRSRVIWANAAGCRMWKADTLTELRARDFASDMSVTVATRLKEYQRGFERSAATFSEVWTHYPKGVPSTIRVTYSGLRLEDGRFAMLCEGREEVKEVPEKLRSAEALVHTSVMITLYEESGSALYRNPAAGEMSPGEAKGFDAHFVHEADFDLIKKGLDQNSHAQIIAKVHTARGIRWHEITARRCLDPVTGKPAWLISEVDVSEIKSTEALAQHAALHDPLTHLPNRTYVQSIFEQKLEAMLARSAKAALLFLDLDRFKAINDSFGHAKGDQVLIEVARRLLQTIGSRGDVARLSGDEFLVLLEFTTDEDLEGVVESLLAAIHTPIVLGEQRFQLTSSVGVSIAPVDGTTVASLMKNSDSAMYGAKNVGGNRATQYTTSMGLNALSRMRTELDLRTAFEQRRLELYYQPRVSVSTGQIASAEVLLRWPRADGFLSPDVFIPVAEESGLIVPIGAWVLEQAARQQAAWHDAGYPLKLSVNVSPRQLMEIDFVDVARAALIQTGQCSAGLELEITERMLLNEQPHVSATLDELRRAGYGISVDDFGVGYSNLAELHRYPIDCLKIDRSFISNLEKHAPLMELIINMGRLMRLRTVAEGVETLDQLAWLSDRGCDEYQGYYHSKPMPAQEMEALLMKASADVPSSRKNNAA